MPGEALSPTQPFPTAPQPFSRQKFTVDDLNPHILTAEERDAFSQRIAKARNDGPFTPIDFEEVDPHAGQPGRLELGKHRVEPVRRQRLRDRLQRTDDHAAAQAGRERSGRGGAPPEIVQEGRYVTEGFGLFPTIISPPYTTLTAYDLNAGRIKWQIGLGDDPRLISQSVKGTGAAMTVKGGIIRTATGLLFVTAADRKVHVYDSADGRQLWELPLGGADVRLAVNVRAGRRTVSARHRIGRWRFRSAGRDRRVRGAVTRVVGYLPSVVSTLPGRALVCSPFETTGTPFTITYGMPTA